MEERARFFKMWRQAEAKVRRYMFIFRYREQCTYEEYCEATHEIDYWVQARDYWEMKARAAAEAAD